jgi:hypothetical protein
MSDPEPDSLFRARLLRVVARKDLHVTLFGLGDQLDNIGRKYGRFRTGVPLKGVEAGWYRS